MLKEMTAHEAEDLKEVLEYLWLPELEDYIEAHSPDFLPDVPHIFTKLVCLDRFLYGHNKTPRDFVLESGWKER